MNEWQNLIDFILYSEGNNHIVVRDGDTVDSIMLDRTYSYEDIMKYGRILESFHQEFIQTEILGYSYENRSILLLKVGKGQQKILCTGGVHGRESVTPIVLMKVIETYANLYRYRENLKNYKDMRMTPFSVRRILDQVTIYFVPLVNPDGYAIAGEGAEAFRLWKENARGVDINRNFSSRTFQKGSNEAGSEIETRILMRLMDENDFFGYMDFHSRGKSIYYHRKEMDAAYNKRQKVFARYFQALCGYQLVEPENEIEAGDSGGNTVHYFSETKFQPAFTIETVPDEAEFPLSFRYQEEAYQEIAVLPLAFAGLVCRGG